jgi:hypothetical protein
MKRHLLHIAAALATICAFYPGVSHADGKLLALYTFNATLDDSSGNGKTATATGTPNYVAGAPFGGLALSFDGTGKVIVTAPLNISPQALKQLTFGAWVKALAVDNPQYGIISNDDGNFDRSIDIDTRPSALPDWSAFVGGSVVGKVPARPGKWVFVAVSFDQSSGPGRYAFYVHDGSQTTVLTGNDAFDADSVTAGVTIGRNPKFDQPFKGDIADAFFYNGILTRAQIAKIIALGPSAIPR